MGKICACETNPDCILARWSKKVESKLANANKVIKALEYAFKVSRESFEWAAFLHYQRGLGTWHSLDIAAEKIAAIKIKVEALQNGKGDGE